MNPSNQDCDQHNPSSTKIPSTLWGKIKSWVKYCFCFCKALFFSSGLLFSDKLIDFSVLRLLITYIYDPLDDKSFERAIIIVNVQELASSFFEIILKFMSQRYFDRLLLITVSALAYLIGLVLLYLSSSGRIEESKFPQYDIAGISLLTLGEAGVRPLLGHFLADELRAHEPVGDQNERRVTARLKVWSWFIWILSAVSAFRIYRTQNDWSDTFKVSAWVTGSSIILFLFGILILRAADVRGCFTIRKQDRDSTPSTEEGELVPKVSYYGKMTVMWSTFLLFGIVLSAGKTFFPGQGYDMQSSNFLPFFVVFQSISRKMISFLLPLLLSTLGPKGKHSKRAELMTIWMGMLVSILCFIVAWRVEVRRLKIFNRDTSVVSIPMSSFWLVPQFCLLGFMEGLAQDGLDEYMIAQFPKHKDYLSEFNGLVIEGIGSLSTIISVYSNESWFGRFLNSSRLDKYYKRLIIISSANLFYYSLVSLIILFHKRNNRAERSPTTTSDLDFNAAEVDERSPTTFLDVNATEGDERSPTTLADVNAAEGDDRSPTTF